jgi:thymidylate synthase
MNKPLLICEDSFQMAWANAIISLSENGWRNWNLVVQINQPESFDMEIDNMLKDFAKEYDLILPDHVAHTIFPQRFYSNKRTKSRFYEVYYKFYDWSRKQKHSGWGTYFDRMIRYESPNHEEIDQLGGIISNINSRQTNYGASYVMVIPHPYKDLNRIMGAPCLNYITVQVEHIENLKNQKLINLMAVYRNHDFTERAYGNYLGLCNLIKYIAIETKSDVGALTCVSSRADVPKHKKELLNIADAILR